MHPAASLCPPPPKSFADINLIDPNASSCGQILYQLAKAMEININREISICRYTSIRTDTGGSKCGNTEPETLITCAELIKYGADPGFI